MGGHSSTKGDLEGEGVSGLRVTTRHLEGSGGMLPQEKILILDTLRMLLTHFQAINSTNMIDYTVKKGCSNLGLYLIPRIIRWLLW